MRIAIVGTGISGLTAAHQLDARHELTLFEAADYVGGHTNTRMVIDAGRPVPIDTGFIVYNEWTYPGFCRLLASLNVATQPSNMSFSVRDERNGLEYAGNNLNSLFAQRRNLLRPSFHRMLRDIPRFFRDARELLRPETPPTLTLGDFVRDRNYSREFIDQHLIPMGAAIWSADPQQFFEFPAAYFARFFHNHGMLNVTHRPLWRTVRGGSQQYVRALVAGLRAQLHTNAPVERVSRTADSVTVHVVGRPPESFDRVILALHSDQALKILSDPSAAEREILGALPYQQNLAVLHTDTRLLPRSTRAWASWNYVIPRSDSRLPTLTYQMNLLQNLPTHRTYLVTLNQQDEIDPAHVLETIEYHHPAYTVAGIAAQQRWAEISGVNRTHFCGAYWGFGFHEDGLQSGLAAARQIEPG